MTQLLAQKIQALLDAQKCQWHQCRTGYESLQTAVVKEFDCGTYRIIAQYNPGRIVSSTAKVDSKSIGRRKCFLCKNNRPSEQDGIDCANGFVVLCNPAPIFSSHFTISHINHIPQSILNSFDSLLVISKELGPTITVIYNGPQSGASAPDHLHFQAFTSSIMPVESEIKENGRVEMIRDGLGFVKLYDRTILTLQSASHKKLHKDFTDLYNCFAEATDTTQEPLMNLIAKYDNGTWLVLVILRQRHRPDYYFKEGTEQMIISLGAIDMGGFLVTPRKVDFDRLTVELIRDIYRQVSLKEEIFHQIMLSQVG
ncbi:MAG TPA: DUF4922 domain-containing protein [Thermodesulfovibrionia bacterium]|nr:DUF4922 domain-containing protein [Thermodesulfovibrionia bacterium]